MTLSQKHEHILGVKISSSQESDLLDLISRKLKSGQRFFIATPNPEIIYRSQTNDLYKNVLNSADISLPDGAGLKLAERILGLPQIKTIPGRVFMLQLFKLADSQKLKIYLLGSTSEVIRKSLVKLDKEYPNAKVYGNSGPILDNSANPTNEQERRTEADVIKNINEVKPDLLFIGFGAPKQELWYEMHKQELKVEGVMVVGGSFDYYSGKKPLPPKFISTLGIEWLWRLLNEAGHMNRVVTAVILFPLMVLKSKAKGS